LARAAAGADRCGRDRVAGPHQHAHAEFGSFEDRVHDRTAEHTGSAQEEYPTFTGHGNHYLPREAWGQDRVDINNVDEPVVIETSAPDAAAFSSEPFARPPPRLFS
jgi:hypothetical protein